jgi:ubiquinone/menaquinone biosynthesis C-methylase UbiE
VDPPTQPTVNTLRTYERIAPYYDLLDLPFEYGRYRTLRRQLFSGLGGLILDAGVGTGRNAAFYPAGSEVVGIDLSPAMIRRASRRCSHSTASVRLLQMDLTQLHFPDGMFDAAVASFVFCTMPSEARVAALKELRRVVKPAGQIRVLEYAPARTPARSLLARLWKPWVNWAFGAKLDQDIERELSGASLTVIESGYVTASIKLIVAASSIDPSRR